MFEYVKGNPNSIESYAEELIDDFEEEIIEIYKNYIRDAASKSSNRRAYQSVCYTLTRYKKVAGKQKQKELINEFKDLYRRRPAFMDELGKI